MAIDQDQEENSDISVAGANNLTIEYVAYLKVVYSWVVMVSA